MKSKSHKRNGKVRKKDNSIFLDSGPKGWWDNRKVRWRQAKTTATDPKTYYERRLGAFLSRMQEVAEQNVKRIYVEKAHMCPQVTSKAQSFTLEELQEISRRARDLGLKFWIVSEEETHKARSDSGLPPKSTRDKKEQEKIRKEEGWVDAVAWKKYLPKAEIKPRLWRCPTKKTLDNNKFLNDVREQARARLNHYQRYEYSTESELGWRIPEAEALRDSLDLQPLERKIVGTKPYLMTLYEMTHKADGTPYGLSSANLARLVGDYKPARHSKFRGMFFAPVYGIISVLLEEGYSRKELRKALRSVAKKFNSGGKREYKLTGERTVLSDMETLPTPQKKESGGKGEYGASGERTVLSDTGTLPSPGKTTQKEIGGMREYMDTGERSVLSDMMTLPAPRRKTKTQKEPVNV